MSRPVPYRASPDSGRPQKICPPPPPATLALTAHSAPGFHPVTRPGTPCRLASKQARAARAVAADRLISRGKRTNRPPGDRQTGCTSCPLQSATSVLRPLPIKLLGQRRRLSTWPGRQRGKAGPSVSKSASCWPAKAGPTGRGGDPDPTPHPCPNGKSPLRRQSATASTLVRCTAQHTTRNRALRRPCIARTPVKSNPSQPPELRILLWGIGATPRMAMLPCLVPKIQCYQAHLTHTHTHTHAVRRIDAAMDPGRAGSPVLWASC